MKAKVNEDTLIEIDRVSNDIAMAMSQSLQESELTLVQGMAAAIGGFCKFMQVISRCSENDLGSFCESAIHGIRRYKEMGGDDRIDLVCGVVNSSTDKESN